MSNKDVVIRDEWKEALQAEFKSEYFGKLIETLKSRKKENAVIYPPGPLIFAAYDLVPPNAVKVVILGQDPYHNAGEAMGLSFSVPRNVKIPASLRNIYKELQNDVAVPIPAYGDLTNWAKRGVLLLNAFLTVEHNQPGAHKNIGWDLFTNATISYLSNNHENIVFMLWGNFARNKKTLIDDSKHLVLESAHPSPLAGNAFQGCKHFSKANDYLKAHQKELIDWRLE